MRTALVLLLATALVTACSSSKAGASAGCSGDGDCESGLSCAALATFSGDGGSCSPGPKACTKTCSGDADCASLGSSYKCFEGCPGSPKSCGATS
ncbi:MAG TPA: hypothetical protein VIF62_28285 [Labilithrix sp.]